MKAKGGKEKQNSNREEPANRERKGTFRGRKLFFLFYLLIVTTLLTAGTLSKYMTTLTGTGTATVAKPVCELFFPDSMKITGGKLDSEETNIYIGVRNYTPGTNGEPAAISEVAMSYRITMSAESAPIDSGDYTLYRITYDDNKQEIRTEVSSKSMEGTLGLSGPEQVIFLIEFTKAPQTGETDLRFTLTSEQIIQ